MGLLEKAQKRKQIPKAEGTTIPVFVYKKADKKNLISLGLLEKTKQRREKLISDIVSDIEEVKVAEPDKLKKKLPKFAAIEKTGKEVLEEKTGFGWKGLGTRRIIFDHDTNEYAYELLEPVLNQDELEIKNELSHLFKMLADVNISNMTKKEKEMYLEKTLEQIIIDNDIKFGEKRKIKSEKATGFFKKKKETEKNKKDEKVTEPTKTTEELTTKEKEIEKNKIDEITTEPTKTTEEITVAETEKNKIDEKTTEPTKTTEELTTTEKEIEKNKIDEKTTESLKTTEEKTTEEKESKDKIYYHIFRGFLGYGRIDIIMEDEGIEDISCDGHHVPIFIYHKKYDEVTTNVMFDDENELNSFVVRLAQICGKQISIYSPIVDGKLPDGSRLQTTLARTVTKGSTFTIRKFKEKPLTPIDLIDYKSLSLDMAAYFWMAIERGASILFCGGTASGKTTALNALSLFIPAKHKIISIEDTREVNLTHKNWIAGTTRQGFSASDEMKTGKDIDMFDLIRAALRQRPKVVMVGEVRGKEAYSLFQAMATGHTSYSTVHASDIHTLIQRLENPPISLPRALLTSLDIIVFQNAVDILGKTVRRMTSVTEVIKLDPDTNQLIFMEPYKWISKTDDRFETSGASKILSNIRIQNDWSEAKLDQEIKNRKLILEWMLKKKIRDYKNVGGIVSYYSKYPETLLKRVKGEMKREVN